jgi:hypothetical protein
LLQWVNPSATGRNLNWTPPRRGLFMAKNTHSLTRRKAEKLNESRGEQEKRPD